MVSLNNLILKPGLYLQVIGNAEYDSFWFYGLMVEISYACKWPEARQNRARIARLRVHKIFSSADCEYFWQ